MVTIFSTVENSLSLRNFDDVSSTNKIIASESLHIATISLADNLGLIVAIGIPACDDPNTISMYSIELEATIAT